MNVEEGITERCRLGESEGWVKTGTEEGRKRCGGGGVETLGGLH